MAQENANVAVHSHGQRWQSAAAGIKWRRLLVVHGSQQGWERLAGALADQPFILDAAHSGAEAETRLENNHYDAVLLSSELPDRSGLTMVPEINCPVIIISRPATGAEILKIVNSGAADFVTDAVAPDELAVRLWRTILHPPSRNNQSRYKFENFEFDSEQQICVSFGRQTSLTRQESKFLCGLCEGPQHFASYTQLIARIWGDRPIEKQNLRVLAAQMRRKIERKPENPELLLTIIGRGYRIIV